MKDKELYKIPIQKIQKRGYLFMWIVNSKLLEGLEFLRRNGYKYVDSYTYVKLKENGELGDGWGYYLRHCKETCLIGLKGNYHSIETLHKVKDCVLLKKPEHSRKPEDIYKVAESLWPNGNYIELFGRQHNMRDGWVTLGNQI